MMKLPCPDFKYKNVRKEAEVGEAEWSGSCESFPMI